VKRHKNKKNIKSIFKLL